jgi:hypothetical protein
MGGLFCYQGNNLKSNRPVLHWLFLLTASLGLVLFSAAITSPGTAFAIAPTVTPIPTPSGPDRYTTMQVDISLYEWWIAAWHDNSIHCSLVIDHAGLPNDDDISKDCGQDVFTAWKANSAPCSEQIITACPGLLPDLGCK